MIVASLTVNTHSARFFSSSDVPLSLRLLSFALFLSVHDSSPEAREGQRHEAISENEEKPLALLLMLVITGLSGVLVSCSFSLFACHQRRRRKCATFFLSLRSVFLPHVLPHSA